MINDINWAGMVGVVDNISAFRPVQTSAFTIFESLCDLLYHQKLSNSDKVGAISKISAFQPQDPRFNPGSADI